MFTISFACLPLWRIGAAPVEADIGLLQGRQALVYERVDLCQKLLDPRPGVYDLDHNRKVEGKPLDLEGVKPAVRPVAHDASNDRRSSETALPGFEHQPFIQRSAVVLVVFAHEEAQ